MAASARGEESEARLSAAAAVPSERGGGATPATSSSPSTPRGEPAATVLDVAADISRAARARSNTESAFSAAEMRRAEERARRDGTRTRATGPGPGPGSKSPPSSFVDPVSAPGSPEPLRRNVNGTAAVSEEARRRFRSAAATSAHARAFAAPPRPHLTASSAGGAVMGAGRAVAPAPEGPPAMVKSTTRFL